MLGVTQVGGKELGPRGFNPEGQVRHQGKLSYAVRGKGAGGAFVPAQCQTGNTQLNLNPQNTCEANWMRILFKDE
jgi:hypothetical protein